jgi:hypothetical protein
MRLILLILDYTLLSIVVFFFYIEV